MTNLRNQTALVTGATGGIGYEFARLLAGSCGRLVLTGRNRDRLAAAKKELENTGGADITVFPADLSDPAAAEELFRELERAKIEVDILVNNAGFGGHGAFVETNWKKEEAMLAVNVTAMTHLTKLFVKGMAERKRGRIVNVSSTAAFQPGPFMAVYYASKAYVLSFSEALASELKGTGVTVTALCPGPTKTGFATAAGMERTRLFRYAKVASPKDVARCGYQAMMKGKPVAVHGMLNKIAVFGIRLAPRRLVPRIVRWLHEEV
jgi:uncharacterized protein